MKALGVLALLLFFGGYVAGAFGPKSYTRDVGRPVAEVMAAMSDLDLTAEPGAPGSTAEAAGAVKPLFRLVREADRMTWYVMSGDKVATTMTASFEPIDGGRGTRVRTSVNRGDAPDDVVSPAFRSNGLTMALFGMALEGELNKLTAPPPASAETCQELLGRITDSNMAALPEQRPQGFAQGMAEGARNIMRLHAAEGELRRAGCNTNGDGSFRTPEQRMVDAGPPLSDSMSSSETKPGQPMLDPTPSR